MNLKYLWSKFFKKVRSAAIKNSKIHKSSKVEPGSQFIESTMDRHSFCGYDCDINHCDIGAFCSIASEVCIGGGMHPLNWVGMSPVFYEGRDSVKKKFSVHKREPVKRTTIKNDVWIGRRVLIAQGVTVGNGAVIGMGSVVTKDVPDYAIVGGIPAKLIRSRFEDDICKRLQASKWWELSDGELEKLGPHFNNVAAFLDVIEGNR